MQASPSVRHVPLVSSSGPRADRFYDCRALGYDNWVNPTVAGNGGRISVNGPPLHGFQTSAAIVIPANGLVVFAKA
jgi:hypothetical protein